MAFLKVFANGEERTVFLGEEALVVGRDMTSDILVKDPKASRMHCVIEPHGGGWRVRDLDSGNGTRVNGERVKARRLQPEDVVRIGDARILFAGEAAAVVADAGPEPSAEPASGPERPARRPAAPAPRSRVGLAVAGLLLLVGCAVLLIAVTRGGRAPGDTAEAAQAAQVVLDERDDREAVRLGETFLHAYPSAPQVETVRARVEQARRRLSGGKGASGGGYDPIAGLGDLPAKEAIATLERMLEEADPTRRPAVRAALARYRERLLSEREAFFARIEQSFMEFVAQGQYARARELWFFLAGDEDWRPIPEPFPERIIEANRRLENAAAAERNDLLEQVQRAEEAHDFRGAARTLRAALPRFQGTSVVRSLQESLDFQLRALKTGVRGKPTRAPVQVRVDVEKRMQALLARLGERDFAGAEAGLRALAEELRRRKERGASEVLARARECGAAAALHAAVVEALSANRLPGSQIARRWRVLGGGPQGVRVRSKGSETRYAWREVPAELYLALLERHASAVPHGSLGLVVAAWSTGGKQAAVEALERAFRTGSDHAELNAWVAAVLRGHEPVPEGGYVVHAGEIVTRKEYVRREEQALVTRLKSELDVAYAAIRGDKVFRKLDKLRKRMEQLDKARAHALELIFDEKKYFYPYRGTGREGEYSKVQQEVDRRVSAVREIWEDKTTVRVEAGRELQRALERFDAAARQLREKLVDVEDKRDEVAFLRSYLGGKFTVRSFYRTPEELDLIRYSDEVMEFNEQVNGDITPVEREQVRITNLYRRMFGRWSLRLVEKLVLSSRGHCEEMNRLGYFGHFSPTPGRRTPYDRMKLQGYEYGSSENCVMGPTSPQAAHDRWCHSSGHHRNILMPPWTEMGTGQYGRLMTQNYGSAPRWSKYDPQEEAGEDDPLREWEPEDWDGDADGGDGEGEPAQPDDDGIDYGEDE